MTIVLKPGTRLRSMTCATEVIVVRGSGDADVRCGGKSMVEIADDRGAAGAPAAPFDQGTAMGKRYVDADATLELLCTKPGAGSLALGEELLVMKGAKPLPSSD
jgi:hypothetical protein